MRKLHVLYVKKKTYKWFYFKKTFNWEIRRKGKQTKEFFLNVHGTITILNKLHLKQPFQTELNPKSLIQIKKL